MGFAKVASIPSILSHPENCHEYVMPFYKLMVILNKLPDWFKRFVAWILNKFTHEQRLAKRILAFLSKDHRQTNGLHQRWDAWRVKLDEQWRASGIDALLSPCQYHAAFKSELVELAVYHDYYMLWNFCHFPSGVIPVTQVRPEEAKGTYIEDTEKRWLDRTARMIEKSEIGSEGMPLCVQVITQQYRDEECLALMKIVDDSMGHFRVDLP